MRSSDESEASRDTIRCAGVAIDVPGTLFERRRSCLSGEWKLRSIESCAVASDVRVSSEVTEYEDGGLAGLSFAAASATDVGSARYSLQEIATGLSLIHLSEPTRQAETTATAAWTCATRHSMATAQAAARV